MAFSTANIHTTALAAVQAKVEAGYELRLDLPTLCFIFKLKWEPDGDDMRTDFQAACDYLSTQSWIADSSMYFAIEWERVGVLISRNPVEEP